MKQISIIFIFLFFLLIGGCSSSEDIAKDNLTQIIRSGSQPMYGATQADNYVIRVGDQIQVIVWGYPEFNFQGTITETGSLTVPLIGEIVVAGLTKDQLVQEIKQKLSIYIPGEIKVLLNITSVVVQKVTVLGEVTRQDNYAITSELSLVEILSTAGGITADSDLRSIRILRGGLNSPPIEVDLISYIENGNIVSIPIVRPGDTIYVPKKNNVVRELSDFMRDAIFIFSFFRLFN